jgi:uncharacterized SAM-binding protein YcdF (DUF218 family)
MHSFQVIMMGMGAFFVAITVFLVGSLLMRNDDGSSSSGTASKGRLYKSPNDIPVRVLQRLDAVLVLGGGKPASLEEPPVYVQRRCDDAAAVVQRRQSPTTAGETKTEHRHLSGTALLPVLCLSAGTAHLPQLMSASGLPVWESTASAAYLEKKYGMSDNVFVETTSYDTVGNAFFSRIGHTEVAGWKRLLIVTNQFHMARSKAIFDWIFGLDDGNYHLSYLVSPDVGLSQEALAARAEKEAASLLSVRTLAAQHTSMKQVWAFLNTQHDLYTANKLVERARSTRSGDEATSQLVKKSYGGI